MISSLRDKINKNSVITVSLILALLPLITFVFSLIYDRASLYSLNIPSFNNDELIYYYQVDGVVNYGMPQGVFGYHEFYGNLFSFGAWSPVLMINYFLFGKLFGWTAVRAVIYNVVFMMAAMFIFGITARPTFKQAGWISLLYLTYTYIVEGILSVSPEATCYSYVIIMIGLAYSSFRDNRTYKIVLMYVIGILLTLMRPYFLAFMILAGYFYYRKKGKRSIPVTALLSAATAYLYGFICVNVCAGNPTTYVFEKFVKAVHINNDDLLRGHSPVLTSVLLSGMKDTFIHGIKLSYREVKWFFTEGNTGRNYIDFIVILVIVAVWAVRTLRSAEVDKDRKYWCIYWTGFFFAMAAGVVLLFSGWAASRHLSQFILMAVLIFPMEFDRPAMKLITFIVLIYTMAVVPNGHKDYCSDKEIASILEFREELADKMPLELSGGPTWDNTVLWAYADFSSGEEIVTPWQYLFAVPSGFAFNVENIKGNEWMGFKKYSSRYIATVGGGRNEEICIEQGAKLMARLGDLVIYKTY